MIPPFCSYKPYLINKIAARSLLSPLPVVSVLRNHPFRGPIIAPTSGGNPCAASAFSSLRAPAAVTPQNLPGESPNRSSFTVSYLVNSCGLSPERAELASKKVTFETPERPDSVLEVFRKHGFSKTQISRIVGVVPIFLLFNPEKTLTPKLEFYHSVGLSIVDLARSPLLLARSLDNHILPTYNCLKDVLVTDKKVRMAMKQASWLASASAFSANLTLLRELAVPESNIVLAVSHYPNAMMQKHDLFRKTVCKVKEMGFDPLKSYFVLAIRALSGKSSRLIWDRCFEAYKKWGWSEGDILSVFKKNPLCMTLSELKIERAMSFFVNKMGYRPDEIAREPIVLVFSLEKRIIPRCSVIHFLVLKGLIKRLSLTTVLLPVERNFLEKFVTRYEDQLPQLMSIYQRKMDTLEL